tara:strand:+ start:10147 stop:11370 length:1224 start_codon:yes stop_codon:yes gene_type:complete
MVNLFNVFLRSLTLFAKFSLILILAKFLSANDLASYGIIYATIIYSLYVIGLDFYIYSTREYVNNLKQRKIIIENHFTLILISIFLAIFFIGYFASFEDKIFNYFGYFICLLVLEFLSQEIFRILVIQKRALSAGLSLFFRHGLWVYILLGYFYLFPNNIDLKIVLFLWCCGGFISILFGILRLKNINNFTFTISSSFIKKGLKIVIPFFIGTIAYRLLFLLDRFYYESFFNNDILAAYVLFSSICISMLSFADSGIFSFSYPKLIENNSKNNLITFKRIYSKLGISVLLFCVGYSVAILLFTPALLEWIGNPIYLKFKDLLELQIMISFIFVLSMVPHYALYAYKKDNYIIFSHVTSVIIFIISIFLMHDSNNYKILQYALIISFVWMLVTKIYFSIKVQNQMLKI